MRPIALLGLVCALTACSGDGDPDAASQDEARMQRASAGLCEALAAAGDGDVDRAAALFEDEAHAYLHELADRLQATDRVAAAELLEAKQRAEAALASAEGGMDLTQALEDVGEELADAAEVVGMPRPSCEAAA